MSMQAFDLLFYGDSITEEWRGTSVGASCEMPGCPEGPTILKNHYGDYQKTALAIAGALNHRTIAGPTAQC